VPSNNLPSDLRTAAHALCGVLIQKPKSFGRNDDLNNRALAGAGNFFHLNLNLVVAMVITVYYLPCQEETLLPSKHGEQRETDMEQNAKHLNLATEPNALVRRHVELVDRDLARGLSVGVIDLWLAEEGRTAIAKATTPQE
jgi:hypothetical protein